MLIPGLKPGLLEMVTTLRRQVFCGHGPLLPRPKQGEKQKSLRCLDTHGIGIGEPP